MKSRSSNRLAFLLTTTIACSTSAASTYVVKTLPLPPFPVVDGVNIGGGQIAITAFTSSYPLGPQHAYLWIPSSDSLIDLQPPGFASSAAMATNGTTQVGYASVLSNGPAHAVQWSGSTASAVDIHPAGATSSHAQGISPDGQIVGMATFGESTHAVTWTGGNFMDLHPASGYDVTRAGRTDGSHQIGDGQVSGTNNWQALVWSGSADSVINLQPAGYTGSGAMNLWGAQVVGYASQNGGSIWHAAVWDLTAGTFADLNGPLLQSAILATNGSTQVGSAQVSADGTIHAALWHGTSDSYVDLHALLPGNYDYSRATGIDADGNISGVALNADTRCSEAVVWLVPEPAGLLPLLAASLTLTRRRHRDLATRIG